MFEIRTIYHWRKYDLPELIKKQKEESVSCTLTTPIKKGRHWRTDAFVLWYWGRLLRVFWTVRRPKQSIQINPEYSLEGLMLKLKLQYIGHLMWRANSLEKTQKIEGDGRNGDIALLTEWAWIWTNSRRQWRTEDPTLPQSVGSHRVGDDLTTEEQQYLQLNCDSKRVQKSHSEPKQICRCIDFTCLAYVISFAYRIFSNVFYLAKIHPIFTNMPFLRHCSLSFQGGKMLLFSAIFWVLFLILISLCQN